MLVKVTAEHIKKAEGLRRSIPHHRSRTCPLALALKDAFDYDEVAVYHGEWSAAQRQPNGGVYYYNGKLTKRAGKFIRDFDDSESIGPINFKIDPPVLSLGKNYL